MADGWAHGLQPRVISGLVMAAIALVAVVASAVAFDLFVAIVAAILAWEWTRLCGDGRFGRTGALQAAVVVAAVAATALGSPLAGLAALIVAGGAADYLVARGSGRAHPRWIAAGAIYIGLPCIALVWLRGLDEIGSELVLWLFLTVWATDIGAFFAGCLIGGARLAPTISPNKTWAGLGGAIVAAALVSWGFAAFGAPTSATITLMVAGAVMAVTAQLGDLLESAIKRRFSVKDSSRLIPGHGGLFDRVDGLLAAALALVVWHWSTDGSWLAWR